MQLVVTVLDSTDSEHSTVAESSVEQCWNPMSFTPSHVYWIQIYHMSHLEFNWFFYLDFSSSTTALYFQLLKRASWYYLFLAFFFFADMLYSIEVKPHLLFVGCLHYRAFLRVVWCTIFLWGVSEVAYSSLILEQCSLVMRPLPWGKSRGLRITLPFRRGCLSYTDPHACRGKNTGDTGHCDN